MRNTGMFHVEMFNVLFNNMSAIAENGDDITERHRC